MRLRQEARERLRRPNKSLSLRRAAREGGEPEVRVGRVGVTTEAGIGEEILTEEAEPEVLAEADGGEPAAVAEAGEGVVCLMMGARGALRVTGAGLGCLLRLEDSSQ